MLLEPQEEHSTIALQLVVHGKVQGVCYRDWTVQNARELGLHGWVRNQADGTVSAHLEGEDDTVRQMIERMRQGPPDAHVERIDERPCEIQGLESFERR